MKAKKLPRRLTELQAGLNAPELELGKKAVADYSLLRGPSVYLVVRAGTVIGTDLSAPEAGPVIDAAGQVIDPGLKNLYSRVDATLLRNASKEEIREFAIQAKEKGCRNICLFPAHIPYVLDIWPEPATVISFPHGLDTPQMKAQEIGEAIAAGAGELDMVARRDLIHAGEWDELEEELSLALQAAGKKELKVIIESGELGPEEITAVSRLCKKVGIPCIKTSTGITPVGARPEDVFLIRKAAPKTTIKAAGGIRSRTAAAELWLAGADIFGISNLGSLEN